MVKKTQIKKTAVVKQGNFVPVVAVLGHVDHGKTTLLDTIRKTNVAQRETGGITQKIGAYQVEIATKEGKRKITFIDTPGHETFTKIRSRGASVTDLALLVVSAADGVQPQTKESIAHIKNANISYLVVITKIDLPTANEKKVFKELADNDVQVEKLGGSIVALPVSAKTGQGLKELLDMIILLVDMSGLKNDMTGKLEATIIESSLSKGKGPIATAIVKNGTLKTGEKIAVEDQEIKIRALFNDQGKSVNQAQSGDPVEILGFSVVPPVGAKIYHSEDVVLAQRAPTEIIKKEEVVTDLKNTAPIEPELQKFKIILKTDSASSLEAILPGLGENILVIYSAVGEINESDILLAKTSGAFVIGFNVNVSKSAESLAQRERVRTKTYKIIYELLTEIAEVADAFSQGGLEEVLGQAKIIAEFPFDKKRIAGCKVTEGRIARGDLVRIERGEEKIGTTRIKSIREGKNEINKVEVGHECGCLLEENLDFALGDMLVSIRR